MTSVVNPNIDLTQGGGAEFGYDIKAGKWVPGAAAPGGGTASAFWSSCDGYKATYRIAISNVTPAATPTDIFQLKPGTTNTVRIKRYKITGFAGTTAGFMPYRAERRSTANTGAKEVVFNAIGGSAPTVMAHDKNDAASDVIATGQAAYYSSAAGNPTATGTVVSVIDCGRIAFPSATVALSQVVYEYMCEAQDKAIILRGATDLFAISLTGAAVPSGGVFDLMVEWEEDLS